MNSARYYLCYSELGPGQLLRRGGAGRVPGQHYPETCPADKGAKIAMAAWVRLYGEADAEDRSFEVAQIQHVAEMIFRRWPDQEEAEERR